MTADESLETRLSRVPAAVRDAILADIDAEALLYSWSYTGRPSQLAATTDTEPVVLFSAGRGSGKSRAGSEWVRNGVRMDLPPIRVALVGRTAADVRDVMVQGDSGLLNVFPPSECPRYIPSLRRVEFANGSIGLCFSAEEPSQLRGPQFHRTWGDELAAWSFVPDDSGLTAWDNVRLATRLGENPQVFATTTPKRVPAMRELYRQASAREGVALHTATTFDNPHLSEIYLDTIRKLYEGTRLGAQELHAEMLENVEGALWLLDHIEALRTYVPPENLPLRVVGVDPSVSENPEDECGIVVCAATGELAPIDRTAYVLADRSLLGPPSEWAKAVVSAALEFRAPVVAEANQGGALVREAIQSVNPKVQVKLVHAKVGKALRAEPVTLAYDRRRVVHVGRHQLLEDQMTTWVPGETKDSPDRVDALVHALTGLVVPSAIKSGVGTTRISRPGRGRAIPVGAGVLTGRR